MQNFKSEVGHLTFFYEFANLFGGASETEITLHF